MKTMWEILTAIIEFVEFNHIIFTQVQALTNHILELRTLGNDCGSVTVAEGIFIIMHHRVVVIWTALGGGLVLTVFIEIVLIT